MLRDNTIILGIVNAPVFDRSMRQIVRFEDPIRAVVAPTHPLATHQDQPINMEAIYQHTIFRVSMFPKMTAFIDEVAEHGRSGSGGAVISLPMVMALRMVILGKGITFLPESYVKEPVETGQLIFLNIADMPYLESTPVVISLKNRRLDDVHKAFIDILEAYWQSLRSR
jgi:DNA-binding transcriptional LysR family regulator